MYSEQQIEAVTGKAGLKYAQNKNRGGRSSAKGRDFEIAYGAYRVALAAAVAIRSGNVGEGVTFHDQVKCFVDDFIETVPAGRTLVQLKSGGASWNGGDHPLAEDFRLQSSLDAACGSKANYALVVSDDEQRDALVVSRPDDLTAVTVHSFPEGLTDIDLIARLTDLSDALAELSPRAPERIVREQVWRMLVGTWHASRGDQQLADLINAAANGPGAVVAPLKPPYELPDEAKKALDKITDFRFYIVKNFFVFEALGGIQHGIADYHCHTPQFEAFVAELIAAQPADFFAFWSVLKAHV